MNGTRIPGFNSTRSALLIVLLLLAVLALVIPIRSNFRLRRQLEERKKQLADLEVLYPLYVEIMAMEKPVMWPGIAAPPPEHLKESAVVEIPNQILGLAARASVELSAVSPRVNIDAEGKRWLLVDIRALGSYDNLHAFFLRLAQLPSLNRFESIEVKREMLREQAAIVIRLTLE